MVNRPASVEGQALFGVVRRMTGQMRVVVGMGGGGVIGWDMTAALALAEAMGVHRSIAADLLPALEAVMVRSMKEHDG